MADMTRAELLSEGYEDTVEVGDTPEKEEVVEQVVEKPEVDEVVEVKEEVTEIEADPFKDLPQATVDLIKGLQEEVSDVRDIKFRLKKFEQRVGGLTNKLSAAEKAAQEAAKTIKEAPSQEEILAAAEDDEKMDALKEEWPEHAEAFAIFEKRMEKKFGNVDFSAVQAELNSNVSGQLSGVRKEMAEQLVEISHPGWKETVNTQEFTDWSSRQEGEMAEKIKSVRPVDVIAVLGAFKTPAEKLASEQTETLASKRDKRLSRSATVAKKGGPPKQRSFADLSPEEQAKYLLKQGYDED